MLHSKLKTPRRFILLLVRCVKLLGLLNTTMFGDYDSDVQI